MTLQDKFRAIDRYMNTVTYERNDLIEGVIYATLIKQHVLALGPVGTAKSLTERTIVELLGCDPVYANQLHLLAQREEIEGPLDMKVFEATGEWKRRIAGYLPTAKVCILEEIDKAGPAIFGTLLTMLNERVYRDGDTEIHIPLITAMGNLNAMPDDPTGALWDRWLIRVFVRYIESPANFLSLLTGEHVNTQPPAAITFAELQQAQEEVIKVALPADVAMKMHAIKGQLQAEGIAPSDRRWRQSAEIVKASAWLDGRSQVTDDDLQALRHTLWLVPENIDTVNRIIQQYANPKALEVMEIGQKIEAIAADMNKSWEQRADQARWAVASKTALQKYWVSLRGYEGQVSGRAEERRQHLMDRIPEVGAQIMIVANIMSDRETAEESMRKELSKL